MYLCTAPLSRFYYPETRRFINAFFYYYYYYYIDHPTLRHVPMPLHQTCIAGILLRRFHVSGRVLVPQLAGELSLLRLGAVT